MIYIKRETQKEHKNEIKQEIHASHIYFVRCSCQYLSQSAEYNYNQGDIDL